MRLGVRLRSCTCHPDDNPPIPSPRKCALSGCRAAAAVRPCLAVPRSDAREPSPCFARATYVAASSATAAMPTTPTTAAAAVHRALDQNGPSLLRRQRVCSQGTSPGPPPPPVTAATMARPMSVFCFKISTNIASAGVAVSAKEHAAHYGLDAQFYEIFACHCPRVLRNDAAVTAGSNHA
jgi:hypothetical protein